MFSEPVSFYIRQRVLLSDLKQRGSQRSDPVIAHSLPWRVHLRWVSNRMECRVGVRQPDNVTFCAAVYMSTVVEGNSMRWRHTLGNVLVCTDENNSYCYSFFPLTGIKLCLQKGTITVITFLRIYKPVAFTNVSLTGAFSFLAPEGCVMPLGEEQGVVYVVLKLAELLDGTERWALHCLRPFSPNIRCTICQLRVRPNCFLGTKFSDDSSSIGFTQCNKDANELRLDIVDVEGGKLDARRYRIPASDQDLEWSRAVPDSRGWICVASGRRVGAPNTAHFRFWLLRETGDLGLISELVRPTVLRWTEPAAVHDGKFYCMVTDPSWRCLIFVAHGEKPNEWQVYELSPYPNFTCLGLFFEWGELMLYGEIAPDRRDALFKLRFECTDCLLEPHLLLPRGLPSDWKLGADTLLALETNPQKPRLLSIIFFKPPPLKTEAVLAVQRLLGTIERYDGLTDGQTQGRPIWNDWRQKLTKILGSSANSHL